MMDDFESKIEMTECLKKLECLTNAQLDDPRVILDFDPINFPPGAIILALLNTLKHLIILYFSIFSL